MGNVCCAGRETSDDKTKSDKLGFLRFGSRDDVLAFDRAYEINDIAAFVVLCSSQCQIEKIKGRMHPWAADPETIGALAATQLAILASKEGFPHYKDAIREAGGIEVLIELLDSNQPDRLHAAIVALSFLSVDNTPNCVAMYKAGGMARFIRGMKSLIDGVRAACAQTARNIFVIDIAYRKEFVRLGGVQQLIKLLDPPKNDVDPNAYFTQLEALYHLEDLILDGCDEIPELIQAVKNLGAHQKLSTLKNSSHSDLAEAAQLLSLRLSD